MLIGLNGFLGSGKDTVYKRIVEVVDPSAERVSFADPLKLSAAAALGVWDDEPEDTISWMNLIKDEGKIRVSTKDGSYFEFTGRQYLQWYGTEAHRGVFGADFWVDQALPRHLEHDNHLLVVTDVRFPNEIARVKYLGGQIWNIIGVDDSMAGSHASETPINPSLVDVFIANTVRGDDYAYLDDQIRRALTKVIA